MMKAIGLALTFAALWMSPFVAPSRAADPVGRYDVSGTNPGNRGTYAGTATIEKTGETYRVVWQIGSDRYIGTGIGNNEFIAVSYRMGSGSGLAMYAPDGAGWKGIWAYADGREVGTEIWSRR